jgi:ankyrin repeat protein
MPSSDQEESLIDHAFRGNVNQVRDLLLAGVNVNARRDDGTTALYIASEQGHVEVVNALLEQKNVDVNSQRNDDGSTALYMASQAGHVEVVNVLLENNNVNVLVKHDDGSTAVDVAQRFHAIKTAFRQHTKDLQAVEQDRKSLRNAMGIDPARPVVELSYQYIKRYITNRKLGGGVFGDAFLAEDCHLPEQTMFVVKMIKLSQSSNGPSDDARKAFQNELSVCYVLSVASFGSMNNENPPLPQILIIMHCSVRHSSDFVTPISLPCTATI